MHQIVSLPAQEIKTPDLDDRFDHQIPDEDYQKIGEIPIQVILSNESGKHVIVQGLSYYLSGLDAALKTFCCEILGETDSDEEALQCRMDYVFRYYRPFHILEQTMAIFRYLERFQGQVYGNGGDRRSQNHQRKRQDNILEKVFPGKAYRIGTLRRFGQLVCPIGPKGLYRILQAKGEDLPIHLIHQKLGQVTKVGIRTQIDDRVREMGAQGYSQDRIEDEIGLLIYSHLFQDLGEKDQPPPDPGAAQDQQPGDSEDDESTLEDGDEDTGTEDPKDGSGFKAVDPEGIDQIIQSHKDTIIQYARGIKFLLQKKAKAKSLSPTDSEDYNRNHFYYIREASTEFAKQIIRKIGAEVPYEGP